MASYKPAFIGEVNGYCQGSRQQVSPVLLDAAATCRYAAFQDGEHGYSPLEKQVSAEVGGNVLVVASARAEKVAQFVVAPAEPGG